MRYVPSEARVVLIDGPVAVFVHEATEAEILDAYENLKALVEVAARQLHTEETDNAARKSWEANHARTQW